MTRFVPILLLASALAACATADGPLSPPPALSPPLSETAVSCRADVRGRSVSCDGPIATGNARGDVIVGGQRQYVQLATSDLAYEAATGTFTFNTTVQNLIPQPLGTEDGVMPSAEGIRVFFSTLPVVTGVENDDGPRTVTVVPDDVGTFTASNQPYFEYPGYLLGSDNILEQGETSSVRQWKIRVDPNVTAFTFSVLVWAKVPHPGGYVDVSPTQFSMGVGDTATLTGTVRNVVGTQLPGQAVGWQSSDPSVVSISSTGVVTARKPGVATISGKDGDRIGSASVLVFGASSQQYRAVSAGGAASCAVTFGRSIFCIGDGGKGLLGNGEFVYDIAAPQRVVDEPWDTVAVGFLQACALKEGAAYCWGQDQWGALGTGALLPECRTQYGSSSFGCSNRPLPVAGGLRFTRLTAAGNEKGTSGPPYSMFGCGIGGGGAAHCWGGDVDGELGDGAQYPASNPAPVPVAGGLAFSYIASGFDGSCALTGAGAAYCWGNEELGEMGNDQTLQDVLVRPTPVQGGLTFRQIDMGRSNACGVTTDGDVYCWGNNAAGVLGTDQPVQDCRPAPTSPYPQPCSPTPVKVALPDDVTFVRATVGLLNACALSDDGRIWCWGATTGVGAGDPDKVPGSQKCLVLYVERCSFTPVQVATHYRFIDLDTASGSHCAISTTHQWLCWPWRSFHDTRTWFVPGVIEDPVS